MEWYLSVLLFAVSTTVTPGPNNMMIMSSGLNFGIRRSLPHLMGILIGFPLMIMAVGAGLASVFTAVPQLHIFIQIAGLLYLLYFTYLVATADNEVETSSKKTIGFWQAVSIQWINPKAWVIITGAFTAFTTTDTAPFLQVVYITSAFAIVGVPAISLWLFCGALLSRILKQPKPRRYFNYSMAGLLVLSILPIIWDLIF